MFCLLAESFICVSPLLNVESAVFCVCRSCRHERGEERRPGASLHGAAGLSRWGEPRSVSASARTRPHQPPRQSKCPFIVICGSRQGLHSQISRSVVNGVCITSSTYRAAWLSPRPHITCCEPKPMLLFLSFLLITGNKLFIEAKWSHFLFKVDFQDPKNSPKTFSSMESLSRLTSRITTFLTIHIPRGPSHNFLLFPSWTPEVHANVLVYLQMCQWEGLFGFLWEKIWFACLPPVTLCCNCEHVEWKMRFRVNTVIFSSGLLVNTEGVAHLARDKQMPVACEHKHLFYMRDSQRPSFSYKASKTQMWIW